MKQRFKYLVCGGLAGAANGFFGSGGGLFLVPLLTKWCGMDARKSFAVSLSVILPLSALSAVIYWMRGAVALTDAVPYLLGGLLGGILAGRIFPKIPVDLLRRAFGLLLLWGGIRSVLLW
ncbi:MAG: TSUP family transporter [Butyricicoccaceae bacterium]